MSVKYYTKKIKQDELFIIRKKLGQNNGEAIQGTASELWFGQYPIHTLKTWFDKKGMQMKML